MALLVERAAGCRPTVPVRFARAARCGWRRSRTSVHVDTALGYSAGTVGRSASRRARSSSTTPTRRARGHEDRPGGRPHVHRLARRADVRPSSSEADVPLPHRCAGDGAELRRRLQPERRSEAQGVVRDELHARDRRRAQAVIDGKAPLDLRRPGARPLPPADPADQAARRLHRASDAAVLLPGPPRHADRPAGINDPAGSGPYYVAERVVNQRIVLKRNPYYRGGRPANVDQVVWTIGVTPERTACETEQDRIDHCVRFGFLRTAIRRLSRQVRHQPTRRAVLRHARARDVVPRLQPRPAGVQGAGPDPAQEGDQLRARPARRSFAPSATSRASAPTRCCRRRSDALRRHLPARRAEPRGRTALVRAGSRSSRRRSSSTPRAAPAARRAGARCSRFNLKQLGIDLEVKYFDTATLVEKAETRGEPFDLIRNGWRADYADGGAFLEPLIDGREPPASGNLNVAYFDDPRTNARIDAASRLTGEARRRGVGRPRRRPDARQSALGTAVQRERPPLRLAGASAASSSTRSTASTSRPRARSSASRVAVDRELARALAEL